MMKYYKNIENGYLVSLQICSAGSGTEISEADYTHLLTIVRDKPSAPEGYEYRLRADALEWVLVELPPIPEPEEASAEDYENALEVFGV